MMVDKQNEGCFSTYPAIKEETINKLKAKGIVSLFPIQSGTFQFIYDRHDLIARDLTGSGKTLAFALPLVEKFRDRGYFKRRNGDLLAIMLAPTRELAIQISNVLKDLKHTDQEFSVLTVYGGVPLDEQTRQLRNGVNFFVGTTGRVLDHINRGNINFEKLKTVVLDEADQMLNMGFQEDVEKVLTVRSQPLRL